MKRYVAHIYGDEKRDIFATIEFKKWFNFMVSVRRDDMNAAWVFSIAFWFFYLVIEFEGFYTPKERTRDELIRQLSFHAATGWNIFWNIWTNPVSLSANGTWRCNECNLPDFLFGVEQTHQEELGNGTMVFEFDRYREGFGQVYRATYREVQVITERPRYPFKRKHLGVIIQFLDPIPIPSTFGDEDDEIYGMFVATKTIAEAETEVLRKVEETRKQGGEGWVPGIGTIIDDEDSRYELAPFVGEAFMDSVTPVGVPDATNG